MNNMNKVCNMLGLRLFDKFNIIQERQSQSNSKKVRNPYYFTDEGMINNFGVLDNKFLADLIIGKVKAEKIEDTK